MGGLFFVPAELSKHIQTAAGAMTNFKGHLDTW